MKKRVNVQEQSEGGKKGFNLLTGLKAESGNTLVSLSLNLLEMKSVLHVTPYQLLRLHENSREEKQILKLKFSNLNATVTDNEKHKF